MTATHGTLARPASLGNAATAIFALLGLIDVALTGVGGRRGVLAAVVVTRVVSAVLAALVPVHQQGRRPA